MRLRRKPISFNLWQV